MADHSGIEWTSATWNFVTGCTRVSDGCTRCYIERTPPFRMAGRRFDGPQIGATTGVQLHPERLDWPLRWRAPRRVFVNSLSDLFHDAVPGDLIIRAFAVMAATPQHTYQVLTKRPGRMRSLLRGPTAFGDEVLDHLLDLPGGAAAIAEQRVPWPLPNVWLGVSAEDQRQADIRIPVLLDTPAAVRWVSAEPLLAPVTLHRYLPVGWGEGARWTTNMALDWVVAGGESGPGARPAHPAWFRALRDQCTGAGVPFFFKQRGEWTWSLTGEQSDRHGEPHGYLAADGRLLDEAAALAEGGSFTGVWRVGKHHAGRDLDGRTWDDYPAPRVVAV
jgi:protein gp37